MPDIAQLIKPPALQPKNDDDGFEARINAFIAEKWTDLKSSYYVYHSWIWESILMYAGQMWIRWNANRKSYDYDSPEDDFTPRPRINRFAPAIDAIASTFQNIPQVEAVAVPKDDFLKIGIAEVCNILSDHFIKDTGLRSDFKADEDKVGVASQWFTLAGCFFTNTFVEEEVVGQRPVEAAQPMIGMQCRNCDTYNAVAPAEAEGNDAMCPQCGQPMETEETESMMPQMDESGQPMMEPITEKHVRCTIEEPLWGFPRAGAKSMKDTGFIILARRMNLDQIWEEFGIDEIHADAEYADGWNMTAENSLNFFYLGFSNTNLSGKDAALVIRLFIEPHKVKDYPEGCYAVYINGKCHRCEVWPFGDEHPLSKADYKALPTLFFPRSVAFDIAGSVREFLDYSSIIKLHAFTTAVDPWILDDSTNPSEITGRGDKEVHWTSRGPGSKEPHHSGPGQLDNGVYEMRRLSLEDIDNIAMLTAVWRGEEPAGVKSGVAIDALRVQASAMFAGPTKNFANTWKETIRKGVKLYQKEYTLEQLMRIVGENRTTELEEFRKCKLDECIEWIATQQGMPRTQEEIKDEMIELYDRGMLDVNDPAVREKAFKVFGETGMLASFNKDASRARWENASIKNGGMPIFMPEVDDNIVHLQIHGDQIKSPDFLGWSPEAQQAMLQHYLETKQAVAQESMNLQAQQVQGAGNVPRGTNQPQQSAAIPPHGGTVR